MKNKVFEGELGSYTLEITEDGSPTLYSHYFQESCHSQAGAWEETLHNYIYGCQCPSREKSFSPFTIFEVGFATGLGYQATFEKLQNFHFISTEIDSSLAEHFCFQLKEKGFIDHYSLESEGELSYIKALGQKGELIILLGDARESALKWKESSFFQEVHAIYQDPFSPKRNPTLWTYQWFETLKSLSHQEAILSTYSSSKAVWKAMIKAGWKVNAVKGHGQKRLSTRATLQGETEERIIDWCERSPTPTLTD